MELFLDPSVQEESTFEDKVFRVLTKNQEVKTDWVRVEVQDPVISLALEQLRKEGKVTAGQLRNMSDELSAENGVLLFHDREIVPREMRNSVLKIVYAAGHFGREEHCKASEGATFG